MVGVQRAKMPGAMPSPAEDALLLPMAQSAGVGMSSNGVETCPTSRLRHEAKNANSGS